MTFLRWNSTHISAIWSHTEGVGFAASIAPRNEPTDVPTTKSGLMPRSNSARNIPTW